MSRFSRVVGIAFIAFACAAVAWLSGSREYFNFRTETDFLAGFQPIAKQFLQGGSIELGYHPPLYSILVAIFYEVTSDWFFAGRLLSFFAVLVVLWGSWSFFSRAVSQAAGLGSVIALACSPLFVAYGSMATSDVSFLAVFYVALLMTFESSQRGSIPWWFATGFVLGGALLLRTNALTMLALLLAPFLVSSTSWARRAIESSAVLGGLLLATLIWIAYAQLTDSDVFPAGTSVNLALTYFPPDEAVAWADSVVWAEQKFGSVWQVLAYDPPQLISSYLRHLYHTAMRVFLPDELIGFPLNYLVFTGIFVLLWQANRKWTLAILLYALAQVALVNFITYEPRYYLFLVPVLGAGFGHLVGQLLRQLYAIRSVSASARAAQYTVCGLVTVMLAFAAIQTVRIARKGNVDGERELRAAVPAAQQVIPAGARVVARKPHVAFYTDGVREWMPAGDSIADLVEYLNGLPDEGPLFVYYGSAERKLRPEYSALLDGSPAGRFEPVARSADRDAWVLYLYRREGDGSATERN